MAQKNDHSAFLELTCAGRTTEPQGGILHEANCLEQHQDYQVVLCAGNRMQRSAGLSPTEVHELCVYPVSEVPYIYVRTFPPLT